MCQNLINVQYNSCLEPNQTFNYTASSGEIKSMNYPDKYPSGQSYAYVIKVDAMEADFNINFLDFVLENQKRCTASDYVMILKKAHGSTKWEMVSIYWLPKFTIVA